MLYWLLLAVALETVLVCVPDSLKKPVFVLVAFVGIVSGAIYMSFGNNDVEEPQSELIFWTEFAIGLVAILFGAWLVDLLFWAAISGVLATVITIAGRGTGDYISENGIS